ncbi:bifunctional lysylphosphatidylglycerol flippase/synthetase MprF [Miniphocaeibacter massiliensis]|uniref:bifunctional lysylphosphatidylglycerol flippase/synthetase MprF n=1 Tax=Miniphocaeibacter massiliensis TaxID=2041841 RepID=UPI0013ED97F5|nr:bifunctional lysylphosphatidylglycerol flippase/synthetase MprF [Miniphocaeibacter massiliensis]
MEKIKNFYGKNKKIIKTILILVIVVLTTYVIFKEVRGMDFRKIKAIYRETSTRDKIFFVLFGLFCFSFAAIYDFILAAYYKMKMPKWEVFRIGWISQSFNNFIGFGGAAGVTIREFLYEKFDVDRKVVNRIIFIVLFSDIIGLFSLALPSTIGLIQLNQAKYTPILIAMFLVVMVFIVSDKLPIKFVKDEDSIFSRINMKLRIFLTLQSTVEWFLAALFFAVTMKYYQPEISIMESIIVYVLATIAGIISLIPGGLGSFEVACIALFKMLGYTTPNIFVSLLVCRICYTIIPWVVGLVFLVTAPKKEEKEDTLQRINAISSILAYCVLIIGAILVVSVILPRLFFRFKTMSYLFPVYMINRRFTLVIGILLIVLSKGIRQQVKLAFNLSVFLLALVPIATLITGRNHFETVISILILIMLFKNKRFFKAETEVVNIKQVLITILGTLLFFTGYIVLYNIIKKVDFFNDINSRYSFNYLKNNILFVLFPPFVVITTISIMFGLSRKYIKFQENKGEEFKKFEEFFEQYPSNIYSHLFYMNDKNFFLNEKETVMFLYRPYKNHILVLGDPTGEVEDFEEAIDELIIWATSNKMIVSFYQITGKYLEYYIDEGFKFLKIGEDAMVDVQEFNLAGKKNKILRKTINSMETKGLEFDVIYPPFEDKLIYELKAVSNEWLGKRGEMKFSLGAFKEDYIKTAPVFVIKNSDGKIEAFANMLPVNKTKILSIDLMRYTKDAPDGIMDMLFISLFEWGKVQGYEYFDLGIAPLSNVGNKLYSGTKEKLIGIAYNYGNKIYGFKGLRKYKSKFKPEWSSVYIAYKDDMKLPEILISLASVCNAS